MWAIFALICAFSHGTQEACAKRALEAGVDRHVVLATRYLLAVPLLAPLLWFGGFPTDPRFWLMHLFWVPLEASTALLTIRALRLSPVSLTIPFIAFTPIFLIPLEGLLYQKWVGPQGLVGVLLIVGGSYALHLSQAWRDPWEPFRAILREPGTRLMLLTAAIYSITALCAAELTRLSSPWYFSWHFPAVLAITLAPLYLPQLRRPRQLRWHWSLVLGAVALAGMSLSNMLAFATGAHVAYVIALKRLSGAVSVIYGRVWFDEQAWGNRLFGSLIMAAGCLLILLEK